MYKKITFRSMDYSEAFEEHVLTKATKLDKFFKREPQPINIEIIFQAHTGKHYYTAEIIIKSKNYNLVAALEGQDLYRMIDQLIDKIVRNIAHRKEEMGHAVKVDHLLAHHIG